MPDRDSLSDQVACPVCSAPAGVRCRTLGAGLVCSKPHTLRAERAELGRLHAENERLREALVEYGQHNSWRCAHPPHYYLIGDEARDPDLGCPCGLDKELRGLALASDEETR